MSSSDESPEEKDDDGEIVIDGKTPLSTAVLQNLDHQNNRSVARIVVVALFYRSDWALHQVFGV